MTNVVDVACCNTSDVLLRSDGTIAVVGSGFYGELDIPPGLSNVVAISGGSRHVAAMTAEGRVACWGCFGLPDASRALVLSVPETLTNAVAISAGDQLTLALTADGKIVMWGEAMQNPSLQPPPNLAGVVDVVAGSYFGLALLASGDVVGWGIYLPTLPTTLKSIAELRTGLSGHFCALRRDGRVISWGGTTAQNVLPQGLTNIVRVREGAGHSLALRADGRILGWGGNSYGECVAPANQLYFDVSAGDGHSVGLTRAPVPLLQQMSLVGRAGESLAIAPTILCSDPYDCRWFHGGKQIPDAIGPRLIQANIQSELSGDYSLVVSNAFGSATISISVTVLSSPPKIDEGPVSIAVAPGAAAEFRLTAHGSAPLSYQWFFEGTVLPDEVLPRLQIPVAGPAHEGRYRVMVSNSLGSWTSTNVWLSAGSPIITAHPRSLVQPSNWTSRLDVSVLSPTPVHYRWRFGEEEIPGAMDAALTSPMFPMDPGDYSVVVENASGSITSHVAHIRHQSLLRNLSQPGVVVQWSDNPTQPPLVPGFLTNAVAMAASLNHALTLDDRGQLLTWTPDGSYRQLDGLPAGLARVSDVACNDTQDFLLHEDGTITRFNPAVGGDFVRMDFTRAVALASGLHSLWVLRSDGTLQRWSSPNIIPSGVTNIISLACYDDICAAVESNGRLWLWHQWYEDSPRMVDLELSPAVMVGTLNWTSYVLDAAGAVWNIDFHGARPPTRLTNAVPVTEVSVGTFGVLALGVDGRPTAMDPNLSTTAVPTGLVGVSRVFSSIASAMAITRAPWIDTQPESQSTSLGGSLRLSVGARSASALRYQWMHNELPIPGAIGNSYSLEGASYANSGSYAVVLSNDWGSITSSVVSVNILGPPESQPLESVSLDAGSDWTWTVTAAGPGPFRYAWERDGVFLPGATNRSLVFENVQAAQSGDYAVRVMNSFGTNFVGPARLQVNNAAPRFLQQAEDASMLEGQDFVMEAVVRGSEPLTLQWFREGEALPREISARLLLHEFSPALAGSYWLVASNTFGMTTSKVAHLRLQESAPIFPTSSGHRLAREGGRITLGATVLGTRPMTGRWYFDGSPATEVQQPWMTLSEVQRSHEGDYRLVISNKLGSSSFGPFHLTVIPGSPPGTLVGWGSLSQLTGHTNVIGVFSGGITSAVLLQDGRLQLEGGAMGTPPAGLSNVVDVAIGSWHGLALLDEGSVVAWGTNASGQCSVPADIGEVVRVAAGDYYSLALRRDGTVVSWGIPPESPVPNPEATNRLVALRTQFGSALALTEAGRPVVLGSPSHKFTPVPPFSERVIDLAVGYSSAVALLESGKAVGWGAETPPPSATNLSALAGAPFYTLAIRRDGTLTGWGQHYSGPTKVPTGLQSVTATAAAEYFGLAITRAPVIVQHPASPIALFYGSELRLEVRAVGPDPLSIRWLHEGVELPGATQAVYMVRSAALEDEGHYMARVSNAYGSLTSKVATVGLIKRPYVVTPLRALTANAGTMATLTAEIRGAPPLTCDWYFNGALISGAHEMTLKLANVQADAEGSYELVVRNAAGSAGSGPVSLVVLPFSSEAPANTWQPAALRPDGSLVWRMNLEPGTTFQVEVSSDLTNWQSLTNGVAMEGFLLFREPPAAPDDHRFFRVVH